MMWWWTERGKYSSIDRFKSAHNSKSGAKLGVITDIRVTIFLLTVDRVAWIGCGRRWKPLVRDKAPGYEDAYGHLT
jgi:hypothetical protein